MVEPGEAIGLSAVISGQAYEVTAETLGRRVLGGVGFRVRAVRGHGGRAAGGDAARRMAARCRARVRGRTGPARAGGREGERTVPPVPDERDGLLRLMERDGELGLRSAQAVSREFQSAYRDIHELMLARSSSGKLAKLLLSWVSARDGESTRETRIQAPVTHEEMALRIGASRETVTRLLSELKKKDLIKLEGSTLVIKNRTALEAMAV